MRVLGAWLRAVLVVAAALVVLQVLASCDGPTAARLEFGEPPPGPAV